MGFANFILSLSLCFVAITWMTRHRHGERTPRVLSGSLALALALLAHPLPVAWASIAILTLAIPFRPGGRWNLCVLLALLAGIPILGALARALLRVPWSPRSLLFATGADQLAVFDAKYRVIAALLLLSCALGVRAAVRARGLSTMLRQPVVRLTVASAALVAALPALVRLPGSDTPLGLLAPRSSVVVAVCVIGVASLTGFSMARLISNTLLASAWFATIAFDWHSYSLFLARLEAAAERLPRDARVMAAASQPASRIDWLTHVVDQACVGRCISFANYEPSTNVFRVRAAPGNEVVLSSASELYAAESGHFRVPERPTIHVFRFQENGRLQPSLFIALPGTVVARECVDLLWQVPGFAYDRCRVGPLSRY
jgi:hypothetical protein